MIKVAFIARDSLNLIKGGDTVQITQTARFLNKLDIHVDIRSASEKIEYNNYDLLHFFNIIRPADILPHIKKGNKPYAISPILVEYSEFDRYHRGDLSGLLFRSIPSSKIEYLKTLARWIKGTDHIGLTYLTIGHKNSIRKILEKAAYILPNSALEYEKLINTYGIDKPHKVVPNGIDTKLFNENGVERDPSLVLCVARIEGIKNQLNLIKAINGSGYRLILIGSSAANQKNYFKKCKQLAGRNIQFREHLSQADLVKYYQKAAVHVLPSWFETCGLSSLEAAATGCRIVISDRGYTREYFGDKAFYCDPADPSSILQSIEQAVDASKDQILQNRVTNDFTWEKAALKTAEAYHEMLNMS